MQDKTTESAGPTPAQKFKDRAQQALVDTTKSIVEAWTETLPPTHRYHEGDQAIAISTKGARQHATEEEILNFARRLLNRDWGDIAYQQDIDRNDYHACMERGTVFGIYTASDRAKLWAMQSHRYIPPTIMLPDER